MTHLSKISIVVTIHLLTMCVLSMSSNAQCPADTIREFGQLMQKVKNLASHEQIIVLEAEVKSFGKTNDDPLLEIQRKSVSKIKLSQYKTSLQIHIKGDSSDYYLPIKEIKKTQTKIYTTLSFPRRVFLKIKVFRDYYFVKNRLYFLIEDVNFIDNFNK